MAGEINASQLGKNDTNRQALTAWLERIGRCTDSRLNELVPGDTSRNDKEMKLAEYFVEKESQLMKLANEARQKGESTMYHATVLQTLYETINEKSFEEKQDELRKEYDSDIKVFGDSYGIYKHTCRFCERVFYSRSNRARYCSSRCANDSYIKDRKHTLLSIRSNRICLYCKVKFTSKRKDAKYCKPSHRVMDCRKRKAMMPAQTQPS